MDSEKNTKSSGFGFGFALEMLESGKKLHRKGWSRTGLWVELQQPSELSEMSIPYLYRCNLSGTPDTPICRHPWLANQTDILAKDWNIKIIRGHG